MFTVISGNLILILESKTLFNLQFLVTHMGGVRGGLMGLVINGRDGLMVGWSAAGSLREMGMKESELSQLAS